MKSRYLLLSMLLFLLFRVGDGLAASDEQFAAIKRLGALNGVALHCGAMAETQRMKRALVLNLPKRRQLGELFDYETNTAFMKFIDDDETCPTEETLRQQVNEAIKGLEAVYPGQQ